MHSIGARFRRAGRDKGGDIRASKDCEISHPTKLSLISGLQYSALAEYLAGDSKGALERLTLERPEFLDVGDID